MKLIDRRRVPIFIHAELDDMGLHPESFRVYAHLVRRSDAHGVAWPGLQSIGDVCFPHLKHPDTRRTHAIAAVKELVAMGLISKQERRKADGMLTSNAYVIQEVTPEPLWQGSENVTVESQPAKAQGLTPEWRDALMPILYGHSNIKALMAGHWKHMKDISKKLTSAGYTVADMLDWYQAKWQTEWPGNKGDYPRPNQVVAGVAAHAQQRSPAAPVGPTYILEEDEG